MKRLIVWLMIFLCCGVAWAATTTTNYGLYKPAVGDTNWGTLVNNNFDTIDTQMKTNADAISTHTSDNTQAHSDYLINNGDDTTSGTITASGFIGNVTGNVSGTSGSTTGNAGTATALAANGANCNAGNFPLGVDASGAVESCTDVWTEAENTSAGYAPLVSPSFTTPTLGVATATSINKVTITAPATGSTLTIADGKTLTATNTVNLNTMTDGKWCKYTAAGTVLNCDQDAPAGTGDVSDVGDCTGGACLDGTSDGGTYIRLHETASGFYGSITPSGLSGNTSYTLPNQAGILLSSGYLANSAALRGLLSDESGTGAAIFAGGNIGAATATTPAENDNDTSVATTAYVQTELAGISAGETNWAEMPLIMSAGVNWTDLEALAPINSSAVNWADMTDLASGGAVINNSHLHTASTNASVVLTVCSSTSTQFACDYTADGTDDDVQIEAAIDALPDGGGTVVLSEGTFVAGATIDIPSYVSLAGQGAGTIVQAKTNLNGVILQNSDTTNGNTGISIYNLKVDGNKTNQSTTGLLIKMAKVTYSMFDHLWLINSKKEASVFSGEGFILLGSNYNVLSNIYTADNEYDGIKIANSDHNIVTNVVSKDNGRSGVQLSLDIADANSSSDYNSLSNIYVYHTNGTPYGANPTTSGIYIHQGTYNTFSNINVNGTRQGIGFYGTCTKNSFDGASLRTRYVDKAVIDLEDGASNQNYNIFSDITITPISGANGKYIGLVNSAQYNTFDNVVGNVGAGTGTWTITVGTGASNVFKNSDLSNASISDSSASTRFLNNIGFKDGIVGGASDSYNFGASSLEVPNGTADIALTAAGQVYINETDEQVCLESGTNGEVSGEVCISTLRHLVAVFDPDAVCDGAVDRVFLMTVGDDAPEGIKITEWKVSFEADPTTEADLDLKYADAFIGVANAAVIDVLDTTTGASTEDTNANINSGNAVANGKVLYLEFGTAYTETTHQVIFEMWFYNEED